MPNPLIAITTDLEPARGTLRVFSYRTYAESVLRAGGQPVYLPPIRGSEAMAAERFDGFVFAGGDDPRTEPFGVPTHPEARPVHEDRQAFETELLRLLESSRAEAPVLGVCLGMQMMALVAGGELDQHMPDTRPDAGRHWEQSHAIVPVDGSALPAGEIYSKHRQAVSDPGPLRVTATSDDGVIEAIDDPHRPFYLGVQWHPERTPHAPLGQRIFDELVQACRPGA
ncbi:MAG: gamma-glutamyl-gamma-aminobutyrate hydrolase family protein [Phycisphaerales bacterium]|nr:MAG: gamma-glutamyl-gamma-aminobutyrate hydrolase family protein [Phycisphaerales bacterium]